jgi:TRAP-type C4-dicarboxylate transport system permease small subunit
MIEAVFRGLQTVSKVLNIIAGAALTFMMLLTVADVLGRAGGHPIVGTYEIVALSLVLVIGFSIPKVSLVKGHVYMEFLLDKLSVKGRTVMNIFTRLLCLVLFLIIGINLLSVGAEYHSSGEVSPTINLPFFPVVYGLAVCCFLECIVFFCEIVRIGRSRDE